MRADAVRRRQTIVREARRLFAAHGGGVALDAIAEASGVGIATFYRNFDSRAALAEALALSILADMQEASASALAGMSDAPQASWSGFLTRLVELDLGALTAALAEFVTDELSDPVAEAQSRTLESIEALLGEAQSAGLARDDITALELVVGIGMLTRPQPAPIQRAAPHLIEHLVTVFTAGLRPD